jgi:hypothetical protein
LNPYGYRGCQLSEQSTLQDFHRARAEWVKRKLAASEQVAVDVPDPANANANGDGDAEQRMWATAAKDPIAATVIGLGAIFSATLGRLFGFEQDPVKATASGKAISTVVNTVGQMNTPHYLNEMVRTSGPVKDNIVTAEGPNVRSAVGYGARNVNTGPPGVDRVNCGQCTGAVLEGAGGTSTSFAFRANFPEGWTPTPLSLTQQFQTAGNYTGPIKTAKSMGDLMLQLMQFPVGTNVAILYKNPDGAAGHVICAFVGKNKDLLFVDAQMKPPQKVPGPVTGSSEFYFFAVTPKQR